MALASIVAITNAAQAESVTNAVNLPASGEPGRGTPPCASGGGETTADEVEQKLGTAIDSATQYGPIAETVVANPEIANWLKVRLGIHNGPSTCSTLCVNVPADADYQWKACATDGTGTSCRSSFGEFGIGWSLVENLTTAIAEGGNDRVVCVNLRNWKHDRSRNVMLEVSW